MAWPTDRFKDAAPGPEGLWTPDDMNGVQDQLLQVAGYRGKSIIATEQSRTNTAFGVLTTPDVVSSIVLPTNGVIFVLAFVEIKSSVGGAGRMAVFLDEVQLHARAGGSEVATFEGTTSGSADNYGAMTTTQTDLKFSSDGDGVVTTGQIAGVSASNEAHGGPLAIHAAAGTYDVSLRFRATSGSVTAKNRKLWVWTEAFA